MNIMSEEKVLYKDVTGRPQDVVAHVRRVVGASTREDKVRGFKIGITNDPVGRFKRKYIKSFDKMIVVYRSSSINRISKLKDKLIEHNRELADNKIGGAAGD